MKLFAADEVESSMIVILTNNGDRMYLHPFENDIQALEYLELMVASFRADVLESVVKRSMN